MTKPTPLATGGLGEAIFRPLPTDIIGELEKIIRKYVVLAPSAYLPLAIWCAVTWLPDCFDCFPYLALLSPAKRSGKTRLLEVLEILCAKAWRGTAPTSAALYRMMSECPTLLLDELEGLRGKKVSEGQQAVLAVLNAGHRRGATVPRCEGNGKDMHVVYFPVYGPKAFAAIGKLPDTLADRSIIVSMQRRTPAEKVSRFLFRRAKAEARPIVEAMNQWSELHAQIVQLAYEKFDDLSFLSDRDSDLWTPLFALCAVAAPGRVAELRDAAQSLSRAKDADDADDSVPLRLLADTRQVWPSDAAHMTSTDILERLRALDESPWGEFEITARKLAKWLRPFGVTSLTVRDSTVTAKGYRQADFETAWKRYLPSRGDFAVTATQGP